jgi:hypothetical protein
VNRTQTTPSPASLSISRRKRILFTIATVILITLFAELSLQAFYRLSVGRWLWEWWAIPIFQADPVRAYRVKSNLDYVHKTSEFTARYCTDQNGMRTVCGQAGPAVEKAAGTFRIMVLGPSFAFGWGVNYEDSYIYKIAQGLHVPGKRVELINLGTPSQPPPYQVQWLKAVGYRYEPDLIVQTVYGDIQSIDVGEVLPDNKPSVRNGYLYPAERMTLSLWIRRMRAYSAVFFYGWHVYDIVFRPRTASGDGREFYKPTDLESATAEKEVLRYKHYIDYVHRSVTNQPQIAFMFIAPSHVVRPADITRSANRGTEATPFEFRKKTAFIASMLKSNQINIIDPTDVLVENDKATRMYNLYDIHFTVAGNRVAAEYTLPIIQEMVRERLRVGR